MTVPSPIGWPGTPDQWAGQVSRLRSEYRALVAELRSRLTDPKQTEDEYVTRRVLELCAWNRWTVAS